MRRRSFLETHRASPGKLRDSFRQNTKPLDAILAYQLESIEYGPFMTFSTIPLWWCLGFHTDCWAHVFLVLHTLLDLLTICSSLWSWPALHHQDLVPYRHRRKLQTNLQHAQSLSHALVLSYGSGHSAESDESLWSAPSSPPNSFSGLGGFSFKPKKTWKGFLCHVQPVPSHCCRTLGQI